MKRFLILFTFVSSARIRINGKYTLLPLRMELSLPIDPLVAMCSKEIPLSLGKILWQTIPRAPLKICKRGTHGRERHSCKNALTQEVNPRPKLFTELFYKCVSKNEILKFRIFGKSLGNSAEQGRTDDAAPTPNTTNLGEIQIPLVLTVCFFYERHPLCVGTDLA